MGYQWGLLQTFICWLLCFKDMDKTWIKLFQTRKLGFVIEKIISSSVLHYSQVLPTSFPSCMWVLLPITHISVTGSWWRSKSFLIEHQSSYYYLHIFLCSLFLLSILYLTWHHAVCLHHDDPICLQGSSWKIQRNFFLEKKSTNEFNHWIIQSNQSHF